MATVVCGELDSAFDCLNENDGIRVEGIQKDQCAATCVEKALGRSGCCEWQTDWEACIYVPESDTKYHPHTNRLAVKCTGM